MDGFSARRPIAQHFERPKKQDCFRNSINTLKKDKDIPCPFTSSIAVNAI